MYWTFLCHVSFIRKMKFGIPFSKCCALTVPVTFFCALRGLTGTAGRKERQLWKQYWPVVNQWRVVREPVTKPWHRSFKRNGNGVICVHDINGQFSKWVLHPNMRQLPGKASKETRKMKRDRKKGNAEGHQRILTIALPVLLGLFALLVAYVYTTASRHWLNRIWRNHRLYQTIETWM